MAKACTRATIVAANWLHDQCSIAQADNADIGGKLQQTKEKLKEAEDWLQTYQLDGKSEVPDQQLREQLWETERKVKEATKRATKAEDKANYWIETIRLSNN